MIRGLIGRKIGMTQVFDKDGNIIPVTVVEAGPCCILQLKEAPVKVRLGFDAKRESLVRKPEQGLFKKAGVSAVRVIKEVDSSDNKDYKVGQMITADIFKPGDYVDVTGISQGKGFQGGMRRWHWSGGPGKHGSMHHRRVGSIGQSAEPSRTLVGQHMPGHMGAERVTVQGLRVIEVMIDQNLLLIKGAVPGVKKNYVVINRSKKKAYKSLDEKKAVAEVKRNPMKQSKAAAKGGKAAPAAKGGK